MKDVTVMVRNKPQNREGSRYTRRGRKSIEKEDSQW